MKTYNFCQKCVFIFLVICITGFTICCFILKARSQFLFQQTNNQNYAELGTDSRIHFPDGTGKNQYDLFTSQVKVQNGNTQNRQVAEQQAIASQNSQQFATSVSNPANFNLWNNPNVQNPANVNLVNNPYVQNQANRNIWNQVPVNSVQYQINRGDDLNRLNEQAAIKNQNQNGGVLNRTPLSTQNENIATGQIDDSLFDTPLSENPVIKEDNEAQIPNIQETQGLGGGPQEESTINLVKPKIDKIGRSVTHFGLEMLKVSVFVIIMWYP